MTVTVTGPYPEKLSETFFFTNSAAVSTGSAVYDPEANQNGALTGLPGKIHFRPDSEKLR